LEGQGSDIFWAFFTFNFFCKKIKKIKKVFPVGVKKIKKIKKVFPVGVKKQKSFFVSFFVFLFFMAIWDFLDFFLETLCRFLWVIYYEALWKTEIITNTGCCLQRVHQRDRRFRCQR
jgi:hypothetical protein